MSSLKVESETHYMKLIGKEDFNSLKPSHGWTTLDLDYFRMEAHNLSDPEENREFLLVPFCTDSLEGRYFEGRQEGIAISCNGDHFIEGNKAELKIFLKPEVVHRLRFFISHFFIENNGAEVKYYGPSDNELGKIEGRNGWIDFQPPFDDSTSASISRVSIFFTIDFGAPIVDSFELWRREPYL